MKTKQEFRELVTVSILLLFVLGAMSLTGCVPMDMPYTDNRSTPHVGNYPPPPHDVSRVRVGVPPFAVDPNRTSGQKIEELAAYELMTLAYETGRFDVVDRAELQRLMQEQKLAGIVPADEPAAAGQERGIDYLLLGKVTNFRVEEVKKGTGLNVGSLVPGVLAGSSFEQRSTKVNINCGVDLRLVDPAGGSVVVAKRGEYVNTIGADSFGIDLMGGSLKTDGEATVSEDNMGKILRLALDDAIRRMLSDVDRHLRSRPRTAQTRSSESTQQKVSSPAAKPATVQQQAVAFCSECGAKVGPTDKFCARCGTKKKQHREVL